MTLKEALNHLETLGNEKVRARNKKNGADDNQFGVQMGDIRKLAAQIKTDHELGLALWKRQSGRATPGDPRAESQATLSQ